MAPALAAILPFQSYKYSALKRDWHAAANIWPSVAESLSVSLPPHMRGSMAWVCLTCLNCSIFSGLKLHLEAYLPQNPGCPLWKFPWTQMWQKALRDGSAAGEREAGCEKEQAYCVWHMTFKEREAEKKGKIKDKIKCHSQRHAATGKPLIAGFVLTVPYSTLSLIRPRKDLFSD